MTTILGYIDVGKKEGKLLHGGDRAPAMVISVQPTIIGDVDPKARISQEEFLARSWAVIKARDFDHASGDRQQPELA